VRFFYRSVFVSLALVAVPASARAEWKIISAESEPGREGMEHRRVLVEDAGTAQRAVDLAIFSRKSCALQVIDNPDGESLGTVMKREKFPCGVNGGYFDTDFNPIGLRVTDAKTSSPFRRARLITGILLQSSRGIDIIRVIELSHAKKIAAAIQSGPFLVEASERVRGLNDSQRARRTFAGIASGDRAFIGVSAEVSLSDLSNILAATAVAGDYKIQRAINLDGGSSTAFWFGRENGSALSIPGQKPVRDFVAIVPK
jgi:hypothetical protein